LEAAAFSIGMLKDSLSLPRLKKLAASPADNVKIAAILALYQLGDRSQIPVLEQLALANNQYAMIALGLITDTEETLAKQISSHDLGVRINASIALLLHQDPRCLKGILELLVSDPRDLAFYPMASIGRTQSIWKAIPSAELRSKDKTLDLSLSLSMREQILKESMHLPEETFLELVSVLFKAQQFDLIPLAVSLVEQLRTPAALALLKQGCEKLASPLVRDYCHLALFRLKEEGPYEEYIHHWIMRQKHTELIRLKPMLPWKLRTESDYTLTPEETSRFLVDALFAIASTRDIDFLLKAMHQGNPQNRYALFGLLMRATE
jgi:hypothetical protein